MSDITEYERRISAALARIEYGIEIGRGPGRAAGRAADRAADRASDGAPAAVTEALAMQIAALEEALDQERAAVARLAGELADRDAAAPAPVLSVVPGPGAGSGPDAAAERERIATLEAELRAERDSNAQLVERVRGIKDKQEQTVGALEKRVAKLSESLEAGSTDAAKLRRVNGQLRETNVALREALARGLGDAGLINRAMEAELEALRAARASEAAEIDEILAELGPMLKEAANA
ncbi:hypothetical protein [Frigidibacter sp. MR17.24]|uniref:hypothetical protein n=1 Tax=Frigidibacter sp. MR17.24 TaxID=3127345 RepID=UPI003012EF8F